MLNKKTDLKEDIERIYKENFNGQYGVSLYKDRKTIYSNNIELISNRVGYCVAFRNSSIGSQQQLDEINRKYTAEVHYGTSKNYQEITWNVDNLIKVNKKNLPNPVKGYFSCTELSEEQALELFKELA